MDIIEAPDTYSRGSAPRGSDYGGTDSPELKHAAIGTDGTQALAERAAIDIGTRAPPEGTALDGTDNSFAIPEQYTVDGTENTQALPKMAAFGGTDDTQALAERATIDTDDTQALAERVTLDGIDIQALAERAALDCTNTRALPQMTAVGGTENTRALPEGNTDDGTDNTRALPTITAVKSLPERTALDGTDNTSALSERIAVDVTDNTPALPERTTVDVTDNTQALPERAAVDGSEKTQTLPKRVAGDGADNTHALPKRIGLDGTGNTQALPKMATAGGTDDIRRRPQAHEQSAGNGTPAAGVHTAHTEANAPAPLSAEDEMLVQRVKTLSWQLRRNVGLIALCGSRTIDTGGAWYWHYATAAACALMVNVDTSDFARLVEVTNAHRFFNVITPLVYWPMMLMIPLAVFPVTDYYAPWLAGTLFYSLVSHLYSVLSPEWRTTYRSSVTAFVHDLPKNYIAQVALCCALHILQCLLWFRTSEMVPIWLVTLPLMLGSLWNLFDVCTEPDLQSPTRPLKIELFFTVVIVIALFWVYMYSPETTFLFGTVRINLTVVAFPIWIQIFFNYELMRKVGYASAWLDHALYRLRGTTPRLVTISEDDRKHLRSELSLAMACVLLYPWIARLHSNAGSLYNAVLVSVVIVSLGIMSSWASLRGFLWDRGFRYDTLATHSGYFSTWAKGVVIYIALNDLNPFFKPADRRAQSLPYDHKFYTCLAAYILWAMFQQFITLGVIHRCLFALLNSNANFTGTPGVFASLFSIVVPVACLVAWQDTAPMAIVALCVGPMLAWDYGEHSNLITAGAVHGTIVARLYWSSGIDPFADMWQN